MSGGEARRRIDEASKPYKQRMDEARQKFVTAGMMTAEEAKAIVGQDDETRKRKRKGKKDLQKMLNGVEKEKNKAIHLARGCDGMFAMEEQRKVADASTKFEKQMDKIREEFVRCEVVTAEEAKAFVPDIENDTEDDGGKKDKDAEEEPPRAVTDKGFPVTKAGYEKFLAINLEVDKRDQDTHDMYIYNDFSGYGVTEVLENIVSQCPE